MISRGRAAPSTVPALPILLLSAAFAIFLFSLISLSAVLVAPVHAANISGAISVEKDFSMPMPSTPAPAFFAARAYAGKQRGMDIRLGSRQKIGRFEIKEYYIAGLRKTEHDKTAKFLGTGGNIFWNAKKMKIGLDGSIIRATGGKWGYEARFPIMLSVPGSKQTFFVVTPYRNFISGKEKTNGLELGIFAKF